METFIVKVGGKPVTYYIKSTPNQPRKGRKRAKGYFSGIYRNNPQEPTP